MAVVMPVLADTNNTTDGKLGELLSIQLYCETKGLIQGNLGLALGLLIMFGALWSLVKGGKAAPAIISILFGASITALPTIIESVFTGLGNMMRDSGMSSGKVGFEPPKQCQGLQTQIDAQFKRAEENRKNGHCSGGIDCM